MTRPRYAARRDNNEPELVKFAARLGWRLWKTHEPADWIGLREGRWYLIEIKNPDCEGHADEYTPAQVIFHGDVKNCGGRILVWRTIDDVIRDSQAKAGRSPDDTH